MALLAIGMTRYAVKGLDLLYRLMAVPGGYMV